MLCLQPPNFVRSYKVLLCWVPRFLRKFPGFQSLSFCSVLRPWLCIFSLIFVKSVGITRVWCYKIWLYFVFELLINYKNDLGQHISNINVHTNYLRLGILCFEQVLRCSQFCMSVNHSFCVARIYMTSFSEEKNLTQTRFRNLNFYRYLGLLCWNIY